MSVKTKKNKAVASASTPRHGTTLVPVLCVLLGVAVFATFLPSLHNDFINLDDPGYVTKNPIVQQGLTWAGIGWAFKSVVVGNWHPLTLLSLMADCQVYGLRPWGHHLTSILLHAINTALLFLLLRRMTGALWPSFAVAALFGLHPQRIESVAWVAERKDVLSGLFFMLTLLAYTSYARSRSNAFTLSRSYALRSYALTLLFLTLGLMSKPMLVTLPCVLLLLDFWPLRRIQIGDNSQATSTPENSEPISRLLLEKLPFFVLTLASCLTTFLVQQKAGAVAETLPWFARCENALLSYCRYLGKLVWPVNLSIVYPYPDSYPWLTLLGCALLLLAITAIAALHWRKRPYLLVGWLWFLGTLVPVIGFVPVGQQSMADRYMYIPGIGLLIMIVWGLANLPRRASEGAQALACSNSGSPLRSGLSKTPTNLPASPKLNPALLNRALAAVWVVSVLAYVALTYQQLAYWKDSETLFRHSLAVTSNNALAHGCLAKTLADQGRRDEAIAEYRKVVALRPMDNIAHNGLGTLLLQTGHMDEAMDHFQEAVRLEPKDPFAQNSLGLALASRGHVDEGLPHFREAVRLMPDSPDFQGNLGLALTLKGSFDEAILYCREAIRLKPDFAKAHRNLGAALEGKGLLDQAIAEFQEAVRLQPGYAEAQQQLARALAMRNAAHPPGASK